MRVSELNKPEIATADMLAQLVFSMGRLSVKQRQKVYERWDMLHLLLPEDIKRFEQNVLRVHDDSGKDRRFK